MTSFQSVLALAATTCLSLPAVAQSQNLGEERFLTPHSYDGRMPTDYATACNEGPPAGKVCARNPRIRIEGGRAILSYNAISMDRTCNLDGNNSADPELALVADAQLLTPWKGANAVARVREPGGTSVIEKDLTEKFTPLEWRSAHGFTFRIPGGVSCN